MLSKRSLFAPHKVSWLAAFAIAVTLMLVPAAYAAPGQSDYQTAFDFMKNLSVVDGFPDGQAHLNDNLTRAQLVAVLVRAAGQDNNAKLLTGAVSFSDTGSTWASGYIAVAKNQGWASGYPDGKFRPDDKVTYAELIQILDNALGIKPTPDLSWPESAINAAIQAGIISADEDIAALAGQFAPRGAAFYYANNAFLNVPLPSGKNFYSTYLGKDIGPAKKTPPPSPPSPPQPPQPPQPPAPVPNTPSPGSTSSPPNSDSDSGGTPSVSVQLRAIPDQVSDEGEPVAVSAAVYASGTYPASFSYKAAGLPAGLDIDAKTGLISGTVFYSNVVNDAPSKDFTVTLSVYSGSVYDQRTFRWTIHDKEEAYLVPFDDGGVYNSYEGEQKEIHVQAIGAHPERWIFSAEGLPRGLSIDPHTGVISGTISYDIADGAHPTVGLPVTVSVHDVDATNQISFTWRVYNVDLN
ncbi:hypothetical protein SD70_24095 [Gordoniibacillus kamchatkensis]|uniref:SLH domain-containing protein n=1 Tax=Gordoniibacillus kamchatkensis TaxID=1590651 RepID=A0ABR5ACL8_9BACL|nr:putative Ig domain-containing protein [Paenibacillus sp. VKM B-2647]KIL38776.1 hypothetical protein SD70_24095 [Paenibacillus sp. VKM B-2647]